MENLISMTDFVLEQSSILRHSGDSFNIKKYDYIIKSEYYAKFLKQPLELWMFVPCDKEGNVLEKRAPLIGMYDLKTIKYQESKERCLFKGFTYDGLQYIDYQNYCINVLTLPKLTVENLIKYNLTLTETAKNIFK